MGSGAPRKSAAPAAHEVFAHVGCPGPCAEISGRAVVGGTRPFCDAPASQNERERERNAPMPRKTIQKNLAYDTERQLYGRFRDSRCGEEYRRRSAREFARPRDRMAGRGRPARRAYYRMLSRRRLSDTLSDRSPGTDRGRRFRSARREIEPVVAAGLSRGTTLAADRIAACPMAMRLALRTVRRPAIPVSVRRRPFRSPCRSTPDAA